MDIKELTNHLLYVDPDNAAALLDTADRYIDMYNEAPSRFILPRDHAMLQPLIGLFANNPTGLVNYVRGVRDSFPVKSALYVPLHTLYRRLSGRYTQQLRRERMARAMAKATEMYGAAPYMDRQRWAARLEGLWRERRLRYLAAHRAGKKRNTREEVEIAAAEFWDMIDAEIADGERIPTWEAFLPGATQA